MLTILHISDLHCGPPFVPAAAEALLRQAPAMEADVIVASGDFTQRAKREQFVAARQLLDGLPRVPLVVVPGNHDIPLYRLAERVTAPYALYQEFISPELDSVLRVDGAVIVALNSTAPLRTITDGRIRPWQLDLAEEAFRAAPQGTVKIVVAHHHFAPAPDFDKHNGDVMPGAKQSLDRFNRIGVDMILGGHLHRAYIGNSLDLYPSADRTAGIVIAQSGTTTSQRGRAREREKNSFNLIKISDDIVRITHYMFFHEVGGFAPVSRHIFPRRHRHFFDEPHPAD